MHIDLNSCFASIEQQCNSLLRHRPVVVAAYASPRGCILSPSIEAKRFGIKTGMRVQDSQRLCPDVVVLSPSPWKYRWVNQQLHALFRQYTPHCAMKSIDEAVLHFERKAFSVKRKEEGRPVAPDLFAVAHEIKQRIQAEIGDWLRVSVGIAPNRFLAKTGAGLHKPDGLDEINWWNIEAVLGEMSLEDLCGISRANAVRLRRQNILLPLDFYRASITDLRRSFQSITGLYWHLRLHGYEVDDWDTGRKSYSHIYSLPQPILQSEALKTTMSELIHSLGFRLRRGGYTAGGIMLGLGYRDGGFWHFQRTLGRHLYATDDLLHEIYDLLHQEPQRQWTRQVMVGLFRLSARQDVQTTWFADELKKRRLVQAMDAIHETHGKYALVPGRMLGSRRQPPIQSGQARRSAGGVERGGVPDFVAFGGVRELPQHETEGQVTVEREEAVFME